MTLLWDKDSPIIKHALETDVYKILMLFYIWTYYSYLEVTWEFKNRTITVPLARYISIGELREQFQAVTKLRFSNTEIAYLNDWGMFHSGFLKTLQELRLSLPEIEEANGQLSIKVTGTWFETTLWEIYILAIVAELYGRGRAKADGISERKLYNKGIENAQEKINFLNKHPYLKIALFGLRRRASGPWEDVMTEMFIEQTDNIIGVSNIHLAQKYNVEAMGTNAHELAMVEYAVSRHMSPFTVRQSPYEVLRKWERLFGHKALIILSDTFGTDAFLRELPPDIALRWSGHRQDSGDPFEIGEKIITDYLHRNINPSVKRIIFSDGLNCQKMLQLYNRFVNKILVSYGWGTNHSNDLSLIHPLSAVMKLTFAAGNPTVKLSDNLAKGMGPEKEQQVAKEIFGNINEFYEATTY